MSRLAIGYEIGRFTGTCAATGAALAPDSPCVATLSESSNGPGFVRRDYSVESWESGHRPEGLFGYWRTIVPHPDAPRKLLVDDQTLLDIFLRLEDDARPERQAFRFVLALILLRRRMLRSVGREREASAASGEGSEPAERPAEREIWLLLPRGAAPGTPPIRVVDPRLGDADLAAIAEQLGEVVAGDA